MAHGKKKWITTYDGKVKRSNDRTKKDYYRDLKWWDEYNNKYMIRRHWNKKTENFCPQCKHVQKHIREIEAENEAIRDSLREKYENKFGAHVIEEWDTYRRLTRRWWSSQEVDNIPKPKSPEPPSFFDWAYNNEENVVPVFNNFDIRSYLCFKCENKYDAKREMWDNHPGMKENYGWRVRQNYREYRAEVKNIMRRAKYDEDYYDDIPPYVHDWLD